MDGAPQHGAKPDSGLMLFPLLLVAAMLVIALSTLSVIALIGMTPGAQRDALQSDAIGTAAPADRSSSPGQTTAQR